MYGKCFVKAVRFTTYASLERAKQNPINAKNWGEDARSTACGWCFLPEDDWTRFGGTLKEAAANLSRDTGHSYEIAIFCTLEWCRPAIGYYGSIAEGSDESVPVLEYCTVDWSDVHDARIVEL